MHHVTPDKVSSRGPCRRGSATVEGVLVDFLNSLNQMVRIRDTFVTQAVAMSPDVVSRQGANFKAAGAGLIF